MSRRKVDSRDRATFERWMLTLAGEVAKRAGSELLRFYGRRSLSVAEKGRADYVTEADRASESAIREILAREVPDHAILFEESGATTGDSDYEWVIDPLDGTTNFIHRVPFFAVSIALRRGSEPVLGVVYDPIRGELFSAEAGAKTCLNGVEIGVSPTDAVSQALLGTGFPFRRLELLDEYLGLFRELFTASSGVRRLGAAALDLAYVAAGRLDGFWELGLQPWDVAAGSLLVRCAGGQVTDFAGGDDYVSGGDILASNGRIHAAILAATQAAFAGGRPGR